MATASGILSFLGIAAIAIAVAWAFGEQKVEAPGPLPADKVVSIAAGTDVSGIVDQLADENVVESRPLMLATLWLEGSKSKVKAGEYMFKQSASLRAVIDTLVGGRQVLHTVTIPEGLTTEQIADRLRDNDVLVGDLHGLPKEGMLMPDTYKFARGTTRDQIVRNMETEQKRVLADVWSHRAPDTPIRSPYELLTLASIVEKETGKADERPRVAGVFVNRLTRNMPLQSDPTIVYGLVGGKGTLGHGISRSELDQKTPYNTYQITGLPPGPIANPGKAAMEAVANPSRTRELYFVADGTGGHAFADNLDQHRQNVQRWRQIEKDPKDKADPDAAPAPARGNQRGDLDTDLSVYGSLGAAAPGPNANAAAAPELPIAAFSYDGFAAAAPPTTGAPLAAVKGAQSLAGGSDFDELDVEVAGVRSKGDGVAAIDGAGVADPGDDNQAGSMATFPVAPQRIAQERAQAAALGLASAGDRVPARPGDNPAIVSNERFGKVHIIDASEGTSLDPLRDKTYDLNSAKTVPVLRALPRVESSVN